MKAHTMMMLLVLLLLIAQSSDAALTVGTGATFVAGGGVTVVGQEACTLSDGTSSTCLKISSSVSPDHQAGPWCNGGEWLGAVYDITQSYGSIGYDCNTEGKYSVCPSTNPTCTRCLECAVRSTSNTYYIPTAPKKATSKGAAAGDFSATHHPPSLTMKNSRASELMCVQTMARQSLSTEFHSQGRTLFRS